MPKHIDLLTNWHHERDSIENLLNTLLPKKLDFWDKHLTTFHASKKHEDYEKSQDESADVKKTQHGYTEKIEAHFKRMIWRLLNALKKVGLS